jgi:hypothetical protein
MLPIADVHRLAAAYPPHGVTAALLIAASVGTLVVGFIRNGRAFVPTAIAVAYVGIAATMFLSAATWRLVAIPENVVLAAAALLLIVHVIACRTSVDDDPVQPQGGHRIYFGVALFIAALLLFERLGTYFHILVAWEATVLDGFADAWARGQSVWAYLLQRFYWDDGILSAGHTSLFYGAPTYALFKSIGVSPLMLRLPAALATLTSVAVIYLIGARFFGRTAGAALAVLLALSPSVLFYGRYGSSPAGTMLAVLLAMLCAWVFLDRDRSAWWMGAVTGAALFAATLQYAPARIVVLALLGVIAVVALARWRRLWWRRLVGLVLLALAVGGAWHFERVNMRTAAFVNARGETFLHFLDQPGTVKGLIGKDVTVRDLQPGRLGLADKTALLVGVLETTVPQYWREIAPDTTRAAQGAALTLDPPPLSMYYPPLVIFVLWGLGYSLLRVLDFRHFTLLACFILPSGPLLLTNRVDAHRLMLLVVPITFWAGLGVREAIRALRVARMPALAQHVLAAALIASVVYAAIYVLYMDPRRTEAPPIGTALAAEIAGIKGPVILGMEWDHREVAWIHMHMLERARREPNWIGTMMPEATLHGVSRERGGEPLEIELRNLRRMTEGATVIVGPADHYRVAVAALQRRGVRAAERAAGPFRFFRLDAGEAATGVSDAELSPLPTIVIPPTPTPIPLRTGPQVSLSDLKPTNVEFGFAAPQIDREWDNPPLLLGGVRYERGIGMHAWARMTYPVPPNAVELQAIIGVADKMRDNPRAAVTFEVRDQANTLLFDSGLVDGTTPPMPIHVDVRGKTAVILAVTDGGNGIDCDHANWVVPSFLLGP